MTGTTIAQGLPDLVNRVRSAKAPGGRVLSIYLNTSPERMRGGAHVLRLRDGCKALRDDIDDAEAERFESAVAQAEACLAETPVQGHPGVAIFAGGTRDYFYTAPLPGCPEEIVVWEEQPALVPLYELLDNFERFAVLLFDYQQARLLTIYIGEIEATQSIEDDVPRKQATGGWYSLAQTHMARHREEHAIRHAKRAIAALMEDLRARPFDRLILGGPEEAVSMLRSHLPRPLKARLAGSIQVELFATDAAVLREAQQVVATIERETELAQVRELMDAAATPHVVLGAEATLRALAVGRVHLLFLAEGILSHGVACRVCGRLLVTGDRCSSCGGPTRPVDDLREEIVSQALEHGAHIEFLSGEAAGLLLTQDGLGGGRGIEAGMSRR